MKTKLPYAAIIAFIAIGVIEAWFLQATEPLTGLPIFQPTADDAVVVAKRTLVGDVTGKVVIVGDSSAMHGLRPSVMENYSHFQYLNLGTLASLTMYGYCDMAIEILRRGEGRPAAIVLSVLPQTIEIAEPKARSMGHLGRYLVAYGMGDGLIYPVSMSEMRNWFVKKHRFNIFPPELGRSYIEFRDKLAAEKGFWVEQKAHVNPSDISRNFVPSVLSIRSIDRLIKESKSHAVPLVFMVNPRPDTLVAGSYLDDVSNFLKQLRTSRPELSVLQDMYFVSGETDFGTETHLNETGANRHSRAIAPKIDAALMN